MQSIKNQIGLIVWVHDDPITGSAMKLRDILDPKKEEYNVGEKVKFKLPRYGVAEGVIGKIGDSSEKREFNHLIASDDFKDLVGKFVSLPAVPATPVDSLAPVASKKNRKDGKQQQDAPTPSASKKQKTSIQAAASNLELLELELATANSTRPKADESGQESMKPSDLDTPIQQAHANTSLRSSAFTSVASTSTVSITGSSSTYDNSRCSSLVGESLQLLNTTSPNRGVYDQWRTSMEPMEWSPRSYVDQHQACQWLTSQPEMSSSELRARVAELEASQARCWNQMEIMKSQIDWLWKNQKNITENNSQQPSSSMAKPTDNIEVCTEKESENKLLDYCGEENPSLDTDCPFTKEQMLSLIAGQKDFSKASKKLFLKLYSKEEFVGRSLTGRAPNKATPAKPRLENRRKLEMICEVILEAFPGIKEPMINRELADLLKPSRNTQK